MPQDAIHVGLEIGTTKICVVVGECRDNDVLRILAVGEARSVGVRKGEIVDLENVTEAVKEAVADAQHKSDVDIKSVWLAVTGSHIQSFNSRSTWPLVDDRGHSSEITVEDINNIEEKAKEFSIPTSNTIIHSIIQHYFVDGQEGVLNPVGMLGSRLDAEYHIVHGSESRIRNAIRCVVDCGIEVEDVVLSSLASSEVVLTQDQKNAGAIVLDIGGGVTDYLVYCEGAVKHSGILPVGGDHITNDVAIGLRIPTTRAESLKTDEGSCLLSASDSGKIITLKNDTRFSGKAIDLGELNDIINIRVTELLELVRKDIYKTISPATIGSGLVITGGSSLLRGLHETAEEVFRLPVHRSIVRGLSGPIPTFENPRLSTCIGLVKYAQAVQREMPEETLLQKIGSIFKLPFLR